MQFVDVLIAVIGAFILAAVADQLTGKRGLFGTSLVSGVGAVCGWFLAVRVFGVAVTGSLAWIPWSMAASAFCLATFFVFRSKR